MIIEFVMFDMPPGFSNDDLMEDARSVAGHWQANPDLIRLIEAPGAALIAFGRVALGLGLISYGLIAARALPARLGLCGGGMVVIFAPV